MKLQKNTIRKNWRTKTLFNRMGEDTYRTMFLSPTERPFFRDLSGVALVRFTRGHAMDAVTAEMILSAQKAGKPVLEMYPALSDIHHAIRRLGGAEQYTETQFAFSYVSAGDLVNTWPIDVFWVEARRFVAAWADGAFVRDYGRWYQHVSAGDLAKRVEDINTALGTLHETSSIVCPLWRKRFMEAGKVT